ncbi:unnamed protein product [Amoebophrya sp. A25]|nr:unnamed protein product [Amoebophrya sp. A25]|eukprot:GSA25T00027470001.1
MPSAGLHLVALCARDPEKLTEYGKAAAWFYCSALSGAKSERQIVAAVCPGFLAGLLVGGFGLTTVRTKRQNLTLCRLQISRPWQACPCWCLVWCCWVTSRAFCDQLSGRFPLEQVAGFPGRARACVGSTGAAASSPLVVGPRVVASPASSPSASSN